MQNILKECFHLMKFSNTLKSLYSQERICLKLKITVLFKKKNTAYIQNFIKPALNWNMLKDLSFNLFIYTLQKDTYSYLPIAPLPKKDKINCQHLEPVFLIWSMISKSRKCVWSLLLTNNIYSRIYFTRRQIIQTLSRTDF